ncbi:tetratricopeptide repeat protein [Tenacibaculum sp. ZS6-P6]|uniref:ATP-binding protein n=1 Tax=Tenacibaculum sp. ZS6-P6 TaxID=3447503 RepID=UPI003F9A8A39
MRFLFLFFIISSVYSQNTNRKIVNQDSLKKSIINEGRFSYYNKDISGVINSYKLINNLYEKTNDSLLLAKFFQYKAMRYELEYINDSTYYYYNQSKNVSKYLKDSIEVGRRLLSIANLQREARDYLGSEITSVEALQYLEPLNSYKYIVNIYNNLGLVSLELGQEKKAVEYYSKALDVNSLISSNKRRKDRSYLHILNNLGLLYQETKAHKKATKYFEKGLSFDSIKEKFPAHYSLLLENLTYSQSELGKNKFTLEKYLEVLKIKVIEKNLHGVSTTHLNLAEYYKDIKNYSKAKFHAKEGLKFATQTHNNERWLEALKTLSELSTGDESKKYLEEYITLNDSLFNEERKLKNQFAKIRYETDKKEKENTFLKAENEQRIIEVEKQRQQKIIGWLVATLSILILASSVSFFSFRRKKLLFQAQLQKIEAREKERRQIAKSLHDEVAGDLRLLHLKLAQTSLLAEAEKLELVKDNVRNLSHQLSSVSFEKVNFTDQIINLISDYFAPNFIIRAHNLKKINWEEIDNSIKRVLYLSIRESIQNCEKYAQASRMDISFKVHKKSVFLAIQDNGIGFDTTTSKKGIGLQNMQERVEELQGKLTISSEVHKGTSIEIQVPLNA